MTSEDTSHSDYVYYGEEGSGIYSDNNHVTPQVTEKATPLILAALKQVAKLKRQKLYTICDYGAADGGISMNIIRQCIAQLKADDPIVEVQVLYEDLPTNDFKSLFYRLHGYIPQPESYLKDYPGVFAAAIGTGFYEQCVPSGSVDLAISSFSSHWLSQKPCNIEDTALYIHSENETTVKLFKEQGTKDLITFLTHRASELSPGGHAVMVKSAVDELGQHTGTTNDIKESTTETMSNIWKDMMQKGTITKEFINTVFSAYIATKDEILAPFKDENSPVFKAGLRVVSLDIEIIPCSLHEEWMKNGKKNDPEAKRKHASKLVSSNRLWSNHVFQSALSEARSEEERKNIVDELYKRYEDVVAAHPEDHGHTTVASYLHFMKEL